jgi:UDP-N-acetyl-D-glucosamine/UDP-N-acetyl-D-galactosamine dehydrogenase
MLYQDIILKKEKIAVIGLGYVGMPIAIEFSKHVNVIGYDISTSKIELYRSGIDPTNEVGDSAIKETTVDFTSNERRLVEAKFHIVAVPTPINKDNTPNLQPVISASETIGRYIQRGSIIVYESTVYPGVTEGICVPILERVSGLKCGVDFKVGYSPERINPGDKFHRIDNIVKIVSAMDDESLENIAKIYEIVVKAGVFKAESIMVAEAAKVIENSQRDINIAFMNELSIILHKMNINTNQVLRAASTKWNFLNFKPGLVGGHCIGVDPYYLTYKAEELGYHSQVILAGRKINDEMATLVATTFVKSLIQADVKIKGCKVALLGFTFKENCPDIRNTKVIDMVKELESYGIQVTIIDPLADSEYATNEYGVQLLNDFNKSETYHAVVIAVAHDEFKNMKKEDIDSLFLEDLNIKILFDLKGIFESLFINDASYKYWSM